jgi:hypothetical protein
MRFALSAARSLQIGRYNTLFTSSAIELTKSRFFSISHIPRTSAQTAEMIDTSERLSKLRQLMKEASIDVYGTTPSGPREIDKAD